MKTTTCDKCGASTTVRNPECDGWKSTLLPENTEYIDLCPACSEEFQQVKNGAWNAFNATIRAWLGCIKNESS